MARRKRITDEAALEAVARAMFRAGPDEFTLAAAGAEAGLSPATLLQRFGAKQQLIVRAVARDNQRFEAMLHSLPDATGAAAVIAVFRILTPDVRDTNAFADQLLWLRQDMRDPQLNALARERFAALRAAVAERLPPLAVPSDVAARLVEAQWQGALNQWGIAREGSLADYITESLAAWFTLVRKG
jgi:AcrR family transcriptional regulator